MGTTPIVIALVVLALGIAVSTALLWRSIRRSTAHLEAELEAELQAWAAKWQDWARRRELYLASKAAGERAAGAWDKAHPDPYGARAAEDEPMSAGDITVPPVEDGEPWVPPEPTEPEEPPQGALRALDAEDVPPPTRAEVAERRLAYDAEARFAEIASKPQRPPQAAVEGVVPLHPTPWDKEAP